MIGDIIMFVLLAGCGFILYKILLALLDIKAMIIVEMRKKNKPKENKEKDAPDDSQRKLWF